MNNNYDDIINLPHYTSKKHPRMSIESRSAQFAPFSALTGYEDAVKETARTTSEKIEIDNEYKLVLNNKLEYLISLNDNEEKITFTFFVKDETKDGGKYIEKSGFIKKVDNIEGYILLKDKTKIKINDIIDISSKLLDKLEGDCNDFE